jgi:hypothetical protein
MRIEWLRFPCIGKQRCATYHPGMPRRAIISLSLVTAGLLASAAQAQDASAGDPYERLAGLIGSSEVQQRANETVVAEARAQFAQDPDIAYLESECPGTVDVMAAVMADLTSADIDVDSAAYRARVLPLLRREMPPEQAAEAATFFASELGQRLLRAATSSASYKQSLASAIGTDGGAVPQDAFERDRADAARGVMRQMDAADMFEANLVMGSSEWGKTLARLRPQFSAVQYELFNQEPTPEEDVAMDRAFTEALELHLATCDAGPNSK